MRKFGHYRYLRILLLLSVIVLLSCNLQKNMLYYPDTSLPTQTDLAAVNIDFWPSAGSEYRGFIGNLQLKKTEGTIIVFHGNAGNASDRSYYVQTLAPLGYRVILAEYPGYGQRKGQPGEKFFVNDAHETLISVYKKYGSPVFLLGESLGAGASAAVIKNCPVNIHGIILITPWETLLSIAKEKFPWLPVRLFLKDKYDSIENLKGFPGKIAILGAERDTVIPLSHAETLYASISGDKQMWIMKDAGHNDWQDGMDERRWEQIMAFMRNKN